MSSGGRPIGTAKGKQPNTEALCQRPPHQPHLKQSAASLDAFKEDLSKSQSVLERGITFPSLINRGKRRWVEGVDLQWGTPFSSLGRGAYMYTLGDRTSTMTGRDQTLRLIVWPVLKRTRKTCNQSWRRGTFSYIHAYIHTCMHAYIHAYMHSHSHSHNHLSCHLLELPGILHRQVVPALLDPMGPRAA